MDLKYSILYPYHMRVKQLKNTLDSFRKHYSNRSDYEVVIIEDKKNYSDLQEHHALENLILEYSDIKIKLVRGVEYDCCNPAPQFNLGFEHAQGAYLVISNPECVHYSNILSGLDSEFDFDPDLYVVCSCWSVRDPTIDLAKPLPPNGVWYQNSLYRNVGLHFCSALGRDQYGMIGGFDENYGKGMCFEDDDFRNKVLEAGTNLVCCDDLITVHLSHCKSKPANYLALHNINKAYYTAKWGNNALKAENLGV